MKNRISLDDNSYDPLEQVQETDKTTSKPKNSSGDIIRVVIAILGIIWTLYTVAPKSYYVVQVSGGIYNNGIGYIDSHIHSDKSCCKTLVDMWNREASAYPAKIIKVKLADTAYKNSLGQSVPYEAALTYCPYCFNY